MDPANSNSCSSNGSPHILRLALAILLGVLGFAASAPADAHGGLYYRGPRVGVYIGGPLYYGPRPYYWGPPAYSYYYPPAYYYPAPVAPAAPPQYIEKGDAPPPSAATLEPGYWYYCRNPQGYYPSVAQCPGGWEKVAPQPPSTQQ